MKALGVGARIGVASKTSVCSKSSGRPGRAAGSACSLRQAASRESRTRTDTSPKNNLFGPILLRRSYSNFNVTEEEENFSISDNVIVDFEIPSHPIPVIFNHTVWPVELLSDSHNANASEQLVKLIQDCNPGRSVNDLQKGMVVGLFWQPRAANASADQAASPTEACKLGMLCLVTRIGAGTISVRPMVRVEAISQFQRHPHAQANDLFTVMVSQVKADPLALDEQIELHALNTTLIDAWKEEIRLNNVAADVSHLVRHMKKDVNLTIRLTLRSIAEKKFQLHGKLLVQPELLETLKIVMQSHNQLERLKTVYKYWLGFKSTRFAYEDVDKAARHNIQEANTKHLNFERQKVLKSKLGLAKDDKKEIRKMVEERFAITKPSEATRKVAEDELARFDHLEPASSEFNVVRTYLEWLAAMPWNVFTEDNLNLEHAEKILNEDHYGLEEVKETILQFIAIASRKPESLKGKILLLVGPPGTASIAESIARALGRKHFRISGAMSDPAELKGHRRTYLGAVPGKVIYGFKKVQSINPVITIDEIDKIGNYNYRGDPSAVLLELLDPEQNSTFQDHYLDTPFDVSKALFICTANTTDTISAPLLDRMQVIRLSGYVAEEKMAILHQHIIPKLKTSTGIGDAVKISEAAQRILVEQYSREAGVRNLAKFAEKIYRKIAFRVVQQKQQAEAAAAAAATANAAAGNTNAEATPVAPEAPRKYFLVTEKNLREFVGLPLHTDDQVYENGCTPVGVVTGLAWTQLGGSTLTIETTVDALVSETRAPAPKLVSTGNLEDVMKESSEIAYTFTKQFMATRFPGNKFFERAQLHMHVPSGAVKKDGPSAGVTITTSLLSLALNRPVRERLAMTGEITLTGRVVRIGGVREKAMAAKQSGCDTVIFPAENKADFEKLPAYIKSGLTPHFATHYEDVFRVAFGDGILPAKIQPAQSAAAAMNESSPAPAKSPNNITPSHA